MQQTLVQILGGDSVVRKPLRTDLDFLEFAEEGVPKESLTSLSQFLSLTIASAARLVGTSSRSLSRVKSNEKLPEDISTNTLQLARLFVRAVDVFEDGDTAKDWLNTPNKAMDDKRPVDLAKNSYGVQLVLDVLERIEHGIPT